MSAELWIGILSSSVIGGIAGAIISGVFGLRGKRNDYANDYFKIVLNRRVEAYAQIETLVVSIKSSVVDGDGRPYHFLFAREEDVDAVYQLMFRVICQGLWISDALFDQTRELNLLLLKHRPGKDSLIEFGKENYQTIAELRTRIEKTHAQDMLSLHKIPEFLKSKKPKDTYHEVYARF